MRTAMVAALALMVAACGTGGSTDGNSVAAKPNDVSQEEAKAAYGELAQAFQLARRAIRRRLRRHARQWRGGVHDVRCCRRGGLGGGTGAPCEQGGRGKAEEESEVTHGRDLTFTDSSCG